MAFLMTIGDRQTFYSDIRVRLRRWIRTNDPDFRKWMKSNAPYVGTGFEDQGYYTTALGDLNQQIFVDGEYALCIEI